MSSEFKIGDIVYLKAGLKGPLSIIEVRDNGVIFCSWLNENKDLQRQPFHKDELEKKPNQKSS